MPDNGSGMQAAAETCSGSVGGKEGNKETPQGIVSQVQRPAGSHGLFLCCIVSRVFSRKRRTRENMKISLGRTWNGTAILP